MAADTKTIERIFPSAGTHWVGDGFKVHNFFPNGEGIDEQRMSPFYLLDYNAKVEFPPSRQPRGVGTHPHRGFETVTIAIKGKVAHHDSRGNSGVIGEGDVQWMTAGSGILHKEYHEEEFSRTGGEFQMVQIWVNLPAEHKMTEPKYQAIENSKIPGFQNSDGTAEVDVIAGEYRGITGAAETFSPVEMYNCQLGIGSRLEFSLPADYNTALLALEGELSVNGEETVPVNNLCLFANDGTEFTVDATENAAFLILSGQPLNEPIAAYGPFVMNTQDEIRQAMRDFGRGEFGTLE